MSIHITIISFVYYMYLNGPYHRTFCYLSFPLFICFYFSIFFYVSFLYSFFFHQGRVEMKWLPLPAQQQLFPNRIHKILVWWETFTAKTWRLLREALVVSSIEQKRAWQAYELYHAPRHSLLKFIYFEKATNFCKISTADLSYVITVKSMMEISQNFVTFSEFMNFTKLVVSSTEQKRAWQAYELSHAPRHSLMYRMHSYDL